MKRILAVLMAVILLCSCSARRPAESDAPTHAPESQPQTSQAPEAPAEEAPAEEVIPEGFEKVDFGAVSVLVCADSFADCAPNETVTAENNQFIGTDGETRRVIAELLSVEPAADGENPFALCDERYSSAIGTEDLTFHGYAAKKYHIQTQAEGPVPVLVNTLYYCIDLEGQIATFAYYPVMGMGGLHTENIETVLDTIR